VPYRNAAKMQNPLKLAGVPQTNETISSASGSKFTVLQGHVEEILLFNKFFPIVDMCPSYEDIARQSYQIVCRWRILGDFCVLCFQHVSDLHPKFALGPHNVCKYGRHPICEEKKKTDRKKKKPEDKI